MGADKFKKKKKAQRRRSEKLRKYKSQKLKDNQDNPKLFLRPSSFE